MFKKIILLLALTQFSFSQERELIQGKVIYRNINVPAANVINNTSQTSTITNDQGEFEIFAKEGDEINGLGDLLELDLEIRFSQWRCALKV